MTGLTDESRLLRTQGVTAPEGFRATGIAAGIKASGKLDLALVFNEGPDYTAAGVFTRNQVKAAPVLWSQQVLTTGRLRAVILNSGGANACTGPGGFQDTHATAEALAAALSDWGTETGPSRWRSARRASSVIGCRWTRCSPASPRSCTRWPAA